MAPTVCILDIVYELPIYTSAKKITIELKRWLVALRTEFSRLHKENILPSLRSLIKSTVNSKHFTANGKDFEVFISPVKG